MVSVLGCNKEPQYKNEVVGSEMIQTTGGTHFQIIVLDGCEYINLDNSFFTHKGNCKYCKERPEIDYKAATKHYKDSLDQVFERYDKSLDALEERNLDLLDSIQGYIDYINNHTYIK